MRSDRRRDVARRRLGAGVRRWKWPLLVGVTLATATASVWVVFFSTLLAVTRVDVQGTDAVAERLVESAAAVPIGEPLARIDVDAVAARVAAIPAVRSVEVRRQWPHAVLVRVRERTPMAVLVFRGEYRGLDAEGVLFPVPEAEQQSLPRLRIGRVPAAELRRDVARVLAGVPAQLRDRLTQVQATTRDSITLRLRNGDRIVWGSAEQTPEKAVVIMALLSRPAEVYDVSAPDLPTTTSG